MKRRTTTDEERDLFAKTFAESRPLLKSALDVPQPKSHLRLTQTGLEVVVRYPLELERSAEIDDKIIRELLAALEKPPKLRLVGSGTPNIQPVAGGEIATKGT